jgi:serine/threonine protein kinase
VREAAADPARRFGRYILVRRLGSGAMGTVEQAWDPPLGRWVALKILRAGTSDQDGLDRFRQEARVVASLDHPNIIPVYDVAESDGRIGLVMKHIEGRTLGDLYLDDATGPAPIEQAVRHVRDAALGLGYAHARGFVHRDLKPGNLMVDRDGRTYVLDFGLAKVLNRTIAMTDFGRMMGTPAYMSPEQAMGLARDVDITTDIFSLGSTLWAILAGRRPFQGSTDLEVVRAILREPTPSLLAVRADAPEALDGVLFKAMEKDRERRYPSGTEFAGALNGVLAMLESGPHSDMHHVSVKGRTAPPRALIIEDEDLMANVERRVLEPEGIQVDHIADGRQVVERAGSLKPDIVLLDINLPGLGGWEVLRHLRSLPAYNRVPIILVTGEMGEANIVRGFQLGADDYVEKPFALAVLRSRVLRQLTRRA